MGIKRAKVRESIIFMSEKCYYITTAIDYTNAPPHIGHAYEKVLADVIARYQRLKGRKVFFLTGVDQHGQKVAQSAAAAGLEPQEFADEITQRFRALWQTLEISYDGWAATTDQAHHQVVRQVLQRLYDEGKLYKATHKGHYSVRQEQFLTDKERGPDGEFGQEWGEVVEIEEENWYFPLTECRQWLSDLVRSRENFITPAFRKSEVLNALERLGGDLCISRPRERLSWGIEFPFDPGFVTYVWFDALLNYLSFAGYLKDPESKLPDFETLWPCDLHVIGKDILVPSHSVYWPIMLKGMGFSDEQIPQLLVHGWWNMGGSKISKSTGNIVDPVVLCDAYGSSAIRYFLMRDIVTGQDSDYSESRVRSRYTADLANDLGNLLNRTLNMTHRYLGGKLRNAAAEASPLKDALPGVLEQYESAMDRFEIHSAMEAVWSWISAANAYVESSAPWKLAKDAAQTEKLEQVLYHLVETLRGVSVLIEPVIPAAAEQIRKQIQWENESTSGDAAISLAEAEWGGLADGHVVGLGVPIFPRLPEQEQE